MNKSLIAILAGVAISITGCTNAGESTVSDYEQGGYFKEEQQIEQQKEVEPKANTNTNNNTTQPTKINDKQQTERKHNSNRTNTTKQYKKSTKGVDKVKRNSESSEEPKQDNQSTQQDTQENIKQDDELVCPLCGNPIHNGYDNIIVGNTLYHRECYQREFGKNGEYRP